MRFRSDPCRATARAALAAACLCQASLQPARGEASRAAAPDGPAIGCTSLANLRAVLRQSEGDAVAMLAIVTNPRNDLGCAVVDPAAVTVIAEHLNLNGSAYDCLGLKATGICHWVVAGALKPSAGATPPEPAPGTRKPKR